MIICDIIRFEMNQVVTKVVLVLTALVIGRGSARPLSEPVQERIKARSSTRVRSGSEPGLIPGRSHKKRHKYASFDPQPSQCRHLTFIRLSLHPPPRLRHTPGPTFGTAMKACYNQPQGGACVPWQVSPFFFN